MTIPEPAAIQWFAACPRGLESLLQEELTGLGASDVRETIAGVHFSGPRALGYRACLWSRLANRILLPLATVEAGDADALYTGLSEVDWSAVMRAQQSFAVDFSGQNRSIRNTQFGAQRSKDAIVDWFVRHGGVRPSVDRQRPDVRINVHLSKGRAAVAVDFSGGSLHRRGYRVSAGAAPLKENLAAAILLRAGWPAMAAEDGALIDPMCGSGTLLIEGALMAADIAPGLGRRRFGFEGLRDHNDAQWRAIIADAKGRRERGLAAAMPEIRGYDADPKVVRRAQENIAEAGLEKWVRVSCKALATVKKPTHRPLEKGLLLCNPPYGERLGEKQSLRYLYAELGELMAREFSGWDAAVFTSDLQLGRAIGLRSHKQYTLYNGAIETHLLLFALRDNELRQPGRGTVEGAPSSGDAPRAKAPAEALSEGAQMFANRIRKNRKRLRPWLQREGIECYRLYDADMPEYAVAVDIYGDRVHVAEYQAPKGVEPEAAARRMEEVAAALPDALDVAPSRIVYKQRSRQRGSAQYEKHDNRGEFMSVREGEAKLLVNLTDYLDTGLFLDHRPVRLRLAREAKGKDFLNLFCYTGSATVHAALGGAHRTTSVDLSNTYLDWLRKNLAHNGLDESRNRLVRANCLEWLREEKRDYDLILLDPPSFSNSKAMEGSFDVQRDHLEMVRTAMGRLRPDGLLYFSNNRRGFRLAPELAAEFLCEDITESTLDPDFQRNRRIHCCFRIRHRKPGE
ncbi:bifunctional 23S rRNA (guanine(2069)-N(7))-methyltransferase RlmK/23S rRNA (guanine(2445)-N(2))-methyltransferase RlmL [Haliea sp. E17]|uniref:bifunctional 23S rRNA (guanine(2069)-N(7))-methyltransferase RlmK/23S rRNA (guanine(2445)-N(2))-methyltransferase RlmL n=1 Tax=Haliea sp. E17 TaxID=3401576 RepID=UPI003AB0BD0C